MSSSPNHQLPVRIYRKENQFVVAAPLPGLEPEDISITIEGNRIVIDGKERGPRQHLLDLIETGWTIGPYRRECELPESVDGSLANATYGNGVLVLTLPKAAAEDKPLRTEFTLQPVRLAGGEHIGHMGHDIQRTTMTEHRARLSRVPRRAA